MILRLLTVSLLLLHDAQGMQCSVKKTSAQKDGWLVDKIENIAINCPTVIIDDASKSYCCYSNNFETFRCCDFSDFVFSPLVGYWLTIVILILFAILIIYIIVKFAEAILKMCCGVVNYVQRKL